jgi:hypothetical protein
MTELLHRIDCRLIRLEGLNAATSAGEFAILVKV